MRYIFIILYTGITRPCVTNKPNDGSGGCGLIQLFKANSFCILVSQINTKFADIYNMSKNTTLPNSLFNHGERLRNYIDV